MYGKLQEKKTTTELLDKEKEHKKYLENQHCEEVHKLDNEISCLKLELENFKAKLPSTESYIETNKPIMKQAQVHKRRKK